MSSLRVLACAWLAAALLLSGCAGGGGGLGSPKVVGIMGDVKPNFFVPAGVFDKDGKLVQPIAPDATAAPAASAPDAPFQRQVLLYQGAANRTFFAGSGLDAGFIGQLWQIFLTKYKFPFHVIDSAEAIDKAPPSVLVLPSMVVLTERERQAVAGFRARGGSVLATWLTGVRDDGGQWRGFGFMQSVLGAKVEGQIVKDEIRFLNIFGDTPLVHYLPAGQRVWLARPKEWNVLSLSGGQPAAQIMDWSRTLDADQPFPTTLVFDERRPAGAPPSRSVVFGWSEREWLASDPKQMEAVLHNALTWALRQPSAYLAAWPHPYRSALTVNVVMADIFNDRDIPFAQRVEDAGMRATYFLSSADPDLGKSADTLKQLQGRGHELGYEDDKFEGFQGQPAATQAERLTNMRHQVADVGLSLASDAGFTAPMNSYDDTTVQQLMGQGFGFQIGYQAGTEGRLPYFPPLPAGVTRTGPPFVMMPLTQIGPEELLNDNEPGDVVKIFKNGLNFADQAGALSLVVFPNQTLLDKETQEQLFGTIKERAGHTWLTLTSQVATWWRERERVSFDLTGDTTAAELTVRVADGPALQQAAALVLTLPLPGSRLTVSGSPAVQVQPVDEFRSAIVLKGLAPGTYHWQLQFQ
jgi:hypothetical protein